MATKCGPYTYVSHEAIVEQYSSAKYSDWDITVQVEWTTGRYWWKKHHSEERVFTGSTKWYCVVTGLRVNSDKEKALGIIKKAVETRAAYTKRQLKDLLETEL